MCIIINYVIHYLALLIVHTSNFYSISFTITTTVPSHHHQLIARKDSCEAIFPTSYHNNYMYDSVTDSWKIISHIMTDDFPGISN